MVRTSYLRVYQPVGEFSREEQERWAEYPGDDEVPELSLTRSWLVTGALPEGAAGVGSTDGAFIRRVGDELFVCPWRTRLRMLAGLLAFRGSIPEEVADAFVPENEARRAADELLALETDHPEVRSHILHANWHVPLRWFAAFSDECRILTEDRRGLRVRYESPLADAMKRLSRAVEVLEDSWIDDEVTGAVRELSGWLTEFPEGSLLELDYATVAGLFKDDELVEDHSAGDVWSCLDALAAGDVLGAGRTFTFLTERWSDVRTQEVLN